VLFSPSYQGNGWWLLFGLFSLFMLAHFLFGVRAKRRAGRSISIGEIVRGSVFLLMFVVVAMYQVLTHQ